MHVSASEALSIARGLIGSDRRDEAVNVLWQILAQDQGNLEAMALLARTLVETGDFDRGLSISKRGIAASPGDPRFPLHAASASLGIDNVDLAEDYALSGLRLAPNDVELLRAITLVFLKKAEALAGDPREAMLENAVRAGARAVAEDETNAYSHRLLASSLLLLGNTEAAETGLLRAIALDSADAGARTALAACRHARGDIQGTAEALESARLCAPTDSGILDQLVRIRLVLGEYKEAERISDAGAARMPDDPVVRLCQARVAAVAGDLPGAIDACRQSLALSTSVDGFHLMAALLARQGDWPLAARTADGSQALDGEETATFDARLDGARMAIASGDTDAWHQYATLHEDPASWIETIPPGLPLWAPDPQIDDQTVILVHGGSDLGETIWLSRFLSALCDRVRDVITLTDPRLVPVMGRIPGVTTVATGSTIPPGITAHTPLARLPALLGPAAARRDPFLPRQRQASSDDRIGFAPYATPDFAGLPGDDLDLTNHLDGSRSNDRTVVALQFGAQAAFQWESTPHPVVSAMVNANDLGPTLDEMDRCSKVVASDSAIAHLAAAIGIPAIIDVGRSSGWLWTDATAPMRRPDRLSIIRNHDTTPPTGSRTVGAAA